MFVLAPLILLSTKTTENFTQLPCDAELSSSSLPPLPEKPDKEFDEGTKFYGSFDQNKKLSGKGILLFKNGSRYDGKFKNGKYDGCGIYSYLIENTSYRYYIGQYVNGNRNGLGRLKWKNGDEYRGNFKDDKCEGNGVFKSANGASKSGLWHQDNLLGENISCNPK
nr:MULTISPECIES: hypothetical protein [Nostocales]